MIDHFTLSVSDLKASRDFYRKVLEPLGYQLSMEFEEALGFGDQHKPYFWLKQASVVTPPQHIAFVAGSRELVDAFYEAALEAGAKDDGAPGVRAHYHPNYYGAFVIDPLNGHPLEAVCHQPKAAKAAKPKAKAKAAKPKSRAKSARRAKR